MTSKKFFKKPIVIAGIIILIIIAGGYFLFGGKKTVSATATVTRGTVMSEVAATGILKPQAKADLAFDRSGRIAAVLADVSDKVAAGEVIVALENGDALANLAKAKADMAQSQAKLSELLRGVRPEELELQKVKVSNAETAQRNSLNALLSEMQSSFTSADNAVHNYVDQFISNPGTISNKLIFFVGDSQLVSDIEQNRYGLEKTLHDWQAASLSMISSGDIAAFVSLTDANLALTKNFLNKVAVAVNSVKTDSTHSQATIDGWRTAVSTARSAIDTAIAGMDSAESAYQTAKSNLLVEKNQLAIDLAGGDPEEIKAAESAVASLQAGVDSYAAALRKTYIISPISGVVTRQDAKVGEIASANTVLVSVASSGGFEIEANVPEVDVGSLRIDMPMTFTLDAFSGNTLAGKITKIDPAEVVIEGVPTYKTTFSIDQQGTTTLPIKSGMTANITVVTNRRDDVLLVPLRAVLTRDDGSFVGTPAADGSRVEKKVVTGLRGTDGMMEIVSGLLEGEKVFLDRATQ